MSNSGLQNWCSKLMFKIDVQNWSSKLITKIDHQNWSSKLIFKIDLQKWSSLILKIWGINLYLYVASFLLWFSQNKILIIWNICFFRFFRALNARRCSGPRGSGDFFHPKEISHWFSWFVRLNMHPKFSQLKKAFS